MTTTDDTQVRNDSSTQEQPPGEGLAGAPVTPPEAAQDDDSGQEKPSANREARYRTERNEARTQVAELTERVTRMQRSEVERQAAGLHDPAGLWGAGLDLAELLTEDGDVDPERVAEAVAALADSKPYMLRPPRGSNFGQGRRPLVDSGSGTTWGSVLRGKP